MRWTLFVRQKLRIALLLSVVMGVLVLFNLLLQRNINNLNSSVNSIYQDRLLPATEVFFISENLHKKQLAIENYLYQNTKTAEQLQEELSVYNSAMLALLKKFEQSVLVSKEAVFLNRYKQHVSYYNAAEKQIVDLARADNKTEAVRVYESSGKEALKNVNKQLASLTAIQSEVGNKLLSEAKGATSLSNTLSDIQLVLSIVIGVLIIFIIIHARMPEISQPKFKWN